MMTERYNKGALTLSFILGALAAGSVAFLFAPSLVRVRKAFLAKPGGAEDIVGDRNDPLSYVDDYCAEEGVYYRPEESGMYESDDCR